jgi:cob(I)alamin adenosyltransferase
MPRLTKISTKTGDLGETSLGSHQRVGKDSMRVQSYGTLDELASHIGLVLSHGPTDRVAQELLRVQSELLHLGAQLSHVEEGDEMRTLPRIEERHIQRLSDLVDAFAEELGPLANFILPGGTRAAAQLHVARTVCRRAERLVVALMRDDPVPPTAVPYLNRLSDLLFLMARYENKSAGVPEQLWDMEA